jgi:hypothetical protein
MPNDFDEERYNEVARKIRAANERHAAGLAVRQNNAHISAQARENTARINSAAREFAAQLRNQGQVDVANISAENAVELRKLEHEYLPEELALRHYYAVQAHDLEMESAIFSALHSALANTAESTTIARVQTNLAKEYKTHETNEKMRADAFNVYLQQCMENGRRAEMDEFNKWFAQLMEDGEIPGM